MTHLRLDSNSTRMIVKDWNVVDLFKEEMLLCRLVAAFTELMIRMLRKVRIQRGNRP